MRMLIGPKGSGKTKTIVQAMNDTVDTTDGSVVCITKDKRLLYDINYSIRLFDTESYNIQNYEMLYGFICGSAESNYDISHIYIESVNRIIPESFDGLCKFTKLLEDVEQKCKVEIMMTLSADKNSVPEKLMKYYVGE